MNHCRLPPSFWRGIEQQGLDPAAVLEHARLPPTIHRDEAAVLCTAQLFAIWSAIDTISGDPAFSIRLVTETSTARHKLAFLAASHSADYREGLARMARFKRLCSPDVLRFEEADGEVSVLVDWPAGTAAEPALAIDASFALLVELGRRGTGEHLVPIAVELERRGPATPEHEAFFGCPLRFEAPRNRLVLRAADLDRPFPGHNPELLALLTPALAANVSALEAHDDVGAQVKTAIKRCLAGGAPGIARVARELGMSERTLQRRIMASGTTFRALLLAARQDLARQLLATTMEIDDIAGLLGYHDVTSFYRAFREWERTTPRRWRSTQKRYVAPTPG